MYGDSLYGQKGYAEPNKLEWLDSEAYQVDLMQYIPRFYDDFTEMIEIQHTIEKELETLLFYKNDSFAQRFVMTATWGLDAWEQELGLSTDRSKSYKHRREIIQTKLLGTGTTTAEMIRRTAAVFSGGAVTVTDIPNESQFEIKFVGVKGIPPNMPGLIQILEEIKPAHLAYMFAYTYTVWTEVKPLKWGQVREKTWSQLRIYEEKEGEKWSGHLT